MIASLTGLVVTVQLDSVILSVSGVGLRVFATPCTISHLRTGTETSLATSLVVREESLTLYGFHDVDERDTFETLLTVSGIGPRMASAILAVLTPDELRSAVANNDIVTLTRVPGVGNKSAQRMVLELGGKLGEPVSGAPSVSVPSAGTEDVIAALVGLGWNSKASADAVAAVQSGEPGASESAEILRAALRRLGGHNA